MERSFLIRNILYGNVVLHTRPVMFRMHRRACVCVCAFVWCGVRLVTAFEWIGRQIAVLQPLLLRCCQLFICAKYHSSHSWTEWRAHIHINSPSKLHSPMRSIFLEPRPWSNSAAGSTKWYSHFGGTHRTHTRRAESQKWQTGIYCPCIECVYVSHSRQL